MPPIASQGAESSPAVFSPGRPVGLRQGVAYPALRDSDGSGKGSPTEIKARAGTHLGADEGTPQTCD